MNNRSNIKWQPFDAVVPGKKLIDNIMNEKRKVKMPILSDDQKEDIEKLIISSYNNKSIITIKFFRDGLIYKIQGKITKIEEITQKIEINGHISLFFSQIVQVC